MTDDISFTKRCSKYLKERWKQVIQIDDNDFNEPLSSELNKEKEIIRKCLTSNTKTYRYVLPTQLLSKCIDSNLDCRSLQVAWNQKGAFDARSIAHKIIVPFDQENHKVLGGSPEPYVNNPLRCPAITVQFRERQKNKDDWDKLIEILSYVEEENNVEFTKNVFDQVLYEIYQLLSKVTVVYPTPNRISIDNTISLIREFIKVKSGGERLEAVCTSIFQIIAEKFNLYDEVKREK